MNNIKPLLAKIKAKKLRSTKIRENVLDIFSRSKEPINAGIIISELKKRDMHPNKTTVYRELDNLEEHDIIRQVRLGSMTEYYELADRAHHHHIVCTSCNKILDFTPPRDIENAIVALQRKLEKKNKFTVQDHAFEYFGTCRDCMSRS